MNLRKLGSRIKEQRERRHLRQSDIASALQISSQAVSKWERGENAPDIAVLVELSRMLGVSVEWILGGCGAETDTFEATVFCTSLNGYAKRASEKSPAELAAWANGFHYTVTETLMRFSGVPVKYVGDGFLGFFAGKDHAERAIEAALQVRSLDDSRNIIIALHSGDIYLGTIGHPDYARPDIMGEAVNVAFLSMPWVAKNCAGRIGITSDTAEMLCPENDLRPAGEAKILGSESPIEIYEPPA